MANMCIDWTLHEYIYSRGGHSHIINSRAPLSFAIQLNSIQFKCAAILKRIRHRRNYITPNYQATNRQEERERERNGIE